MKNVSFEEKFAKKYNLYIKNSEKGKYNWYICQLSLSL